MKSAEIKDGKVTIGNGEWYVDKAKPFILKGLVPRQLYILKWDNVLPLEFQVVEKNTVLKNESTGETLTLSKKQLVPLTENDLKFQEKYKSMPELLKETADMRFLKSMKRYAGGEGFSDRTKKLVMFLIFAIVIGVAGFLLTYAFQSGMIKF
jgi:hypothetical protein